MRAVGLLVLLFKYGGDGLIHDCVLVGLASLD